MPGRNQFQRSQSLEESNLPLRRKFASSISVDRYSEHSLHAEYQPEETSSELK